MQILAASVVGAAFLARIVADPPAAVVFVWALAAVLLWGMTWWLIVLIKRQEVVQRGGVLYVTVGPLDLAPLRDSEMLRHTVSEVNWGRYRSLTSGALGANGTLILDVEKVSWEPGAIARWCGVQPWDVRWKDIDTAEVHKMWLVLSLRDGTHLDMVARGRVLVRVLEAVGVASVADSSATA